MQLELHMIIGWWQIAILRISWKCHCKLIKYPKIGHDDLLLKFSSLIPLDDTNNHSCITDYAGMIFHPVTH